jgi:glycosyltransferase involved in cell wall biosynthesis
MSILWNSLHIVPIEKFIGQVDVFHASDWIQPPSRLPIVTTIHDLVATKYPQHLPVEIISTQKNRLYWVKKEATSIISDSHSTKSDLVEYFGIQPERIKVVYLGVGEEFYPQKIDSVLKLRKKYQIKTPYLLSVGTREPRKNLLKTITAFKKTIHKDITLVIAGNFGWGEDIGKHPDIQVLGYVPQTELPALYSGAVSFLYPSLYEGFGLPVLEAMACGCPVITSDRGSLKEIAGACAIIVDPDNEAALVEAIKTVLNFSKGKREQIIKQGLNHAKGFTWQKTAQQTLDVYKSLL